MQVGIPTEPQATPHGVESIRGLIAQKLSFAELMRRVRPRIEALISELDSIDRERGRIERGERQTGAQVSMTPEAAETLLFIAQRFTWEMGKMNGIKPEYRGYLELEDLSEAEMYAILNGYMPGEYEALGKEIFIRMYSRKELLHALFGEAYNSSGSGEDQKVRYRLRQIMEARRYNDRDKGPYVSAYLAKAKTRYCGVSKLKEDQITTETREKQSSREIHTGVRLETAEFVKPGRSGREEIIRHCGVHWFNAFVYGSELRLKNESIKGGRIVNCNGTINASPLTDVTLVGGDSPLNVSGCECEGCTVVLQNNDQTHFAYVTFKECRIDALLIPEGSGLKLFHFCDFSRNKFVDKEVLWKVFHLSDPDCIFSAEQIETLKKMGCDPEAFASADKLNGALEKAASDAPNTIRGGSKGILRPYGEAPMKSDYLDPQRSDIEPVPIFQHAGILTKAAKVGFKGDDLRILPPLQPEEIEQLPARQAFCRALVDFAVHTEKSIPFKKWMDFLKGYGPAACKVLGLGRGLLDLPGDLDALPEPQQINNEYIRSDITGNNENFRQAMMLDVIISDGRNGDITLKAPIEWDVDNIATKGKTTWHSYEITTYGRLQIMRRLLREMFAGLHGLAFYIDALLRVHDYRWPQIEVPTGPVQPGDSIIALEDFYHPNLPEKLSKNLALSAPSGALQKVVPPGVLTANDLSIQVNGGGVTAFTGPNAVAGKSYTQSAIGLIMTQAHAGLPCPGKVVLKPKASFAAIRSLPNLRAHTGGDKSAAEERFGKIEDFLDSVERLAGTPQNPRPVLVSLDEVMMGVTDTDSARTVQINAVAAMLEKPGLNVTVLMIEPDAPITVGSLQQHPQFGHNVRILAADENSGHRFQPVQLALPSSPRAIISRSPRLARLLDVKSWHIKP